MYLVFLGEDFYDRNKNHIYRNEHYQNDRSDTRVK